jgi:hypothetical protein
MKRPYSPEWGAAEGLDTAGPVDNPVVATDADGKAGREWMMVGKLPFKVE